MPTDVQVGDIVAAYPAGSPVRAVVQVSQVTDAGGGDWIVHGTWYFEDGHMESLEVYAGMCHKATGQELEEAKQAYRDRLPC